MKKATKWVFVLLLVLAQPRLANGWTSNEADAKALKEEVREMFWYSYRAYMSHAFPKDELMPLSCTGHDTWGSYALTLIDALDTLVIMGDLAEFARAAQLVISQVSFDRDKNVSIFETNIRVVGGLLSAHLLAEEHFTAPSPHTPWLYRGELLHMAEDVAKRLLPAFDTNTGIPFGTVNLKHGVPPGETPITSLAGAGTHLLEFGVLSRLTGNPVYMSTARTAMRALWARRSDLGLVGNHIDSRTGTWTLLDAGVGSNQDSFYEYLLKGAMLFNDPEMLEMFDHVYTAATTHMKQGHMYVDVHMQRGTTTLPWFWALGAFWPGLQALYGDVQAGAATMHTYRGVLRRFGFAPEAHNLQTNEIVPRFEAYHLRPEVVESYLYLFRATKDPTWLHAGREAVQAIRYSCWTPCGYTIILNVSDHRPGDRMESFFLSETLKYLYLLFDEDNFIHRGNYVFTTEAHYFPLRYQWFSDVAEPSFVPDDHYDDLRQECPSPSLAALLSPHGMGPFTVEARRVDTADTRMHQHRESRVRAELVRESVRVTESVLGTLSRGEAMSHSDVSDQAQNAPQREEALVSDLSIPSLHQHDTNTAGSHTPPAPSSSHPHAHHHHQFYDPSAEEKNPNIPPPSVSTSCTPTPAPTSTTTSSLPPGALDALLAALQQGQDTAVAGQAAGAGVALANGAAGAPASSLPEAISKAQQLLQHMLAPSSSSATSTAAAAANTLTGNIGKLLQSLDVTTFFKSSTPPPPPPPPQAIEDLCFRNQVPGAFWGYRVCFGRIAEQFRPLDSDPSKNAIEHSLGIRRTGAAVRAARTLDDVEDIVIGFTRDSDSFPEAAIVHEHTGGDLCGEPVIARSATVAYYCEAQLDPQITRMLVQEPRPCHYLITINTSLVC
eukprot:m.10074 g.10074  ORF g.10074 m.10074 type:complete len:891 (+) comp5538_c0_seq1:152-2824(+)